MKLLKKLLPVIPALIGGYAGYVEGEKPFTINQYGGDLL